MAQLLSRLRLSGSPRRHIDRRVLRHRYADQPSPTPEANKDGRLLDQPRLVVPGDTRGGRYVSNLTELRVVNLAHS